MGIFLKDIQQFIDTTIAKEHKIVKEIVEEIIDSVVDLSPVDTGNFVTNWLIGTDSNVPWGVTGDKNPDRDATANKLIDRIPLDAANHNYNIVNNSSYAEKLETGVGMKHPAYAMVGITKVRIPSIVTKVIARNR
jgi:hypothetical protein